MHPSQNVFMKTQISLQMHLHVPGSNLHTATWGTRLLSQAEHVNVLLLVSVGIERIVPKPKDQAVCPFTAARRGPLSA